MNITIAQKLTGLFGGLSPAILYKLTYFHNHHRLLNLNDCNNLSAVIGKQILSGEINEFGVYADKIGVRDYINSWGLGEYLPKIYGVWENFDSVSFDSLPNEFALKTNHGCGGNVICFDKSQLDMVKAKTIIDNSMASYPGGFTETHYRQIKRKVFAEELLSENGDFPMDYKIHCWKGEIKACLVCTERNHGDNALKKVYDENWKEIKMLQHHEASYEIKCPSNWDEMKKVAKSIARHFLHVRVDLYSINGKTYIGELTFTPNGGIMRNYTVEGIRLLATD